MESGLIDPNQLGLRWPDTVPGKTTEPGFLSTAGLYLRKIVDLDKITYLFKGQGVIPDSATFIKGVLVTTDSAPVKNISWIEVQRAFKLESADVGKSNLTGGAVIYDFPKIGVAVTVDSSGKTIRYSNYDTKAVTIAKSQISVSPTPSPLPVNKTNIKNWGVGIGLVILAGVLLILITVVVKKRLKPDTIGP